MFNIDNIYTDFTGKRFLCDYLFDSEKAAKYIEAKFLMSVREVFFFADLYAKGNKLTIDTPDKEMTIKLSLMLNEAINNIKQ